MTKIKIMFIPTEMMRATPDPLEAFPTEFIDSRSPVCFRGTLPLVLSCSTCVWIVSVI